MKRSKLVLVVLIALAVLFGAALGAGFRGGANDEGAKGEYGKDGPPDWVEGLRRWFGSPMPRLRPESLSTDCPREGVVFRIDRARAVFEIPPSRHDFREATLRLQAGPPLTVRYADFSGEGGVEEEQEPVLSAEEPANLVVSKKGGRLTLIRKRSGTARVKFE